MKTLQELFSDPKRWTQGRLAQDSSGEKVTTCDNKAVCFCLVGGAKRVYKHEAPSVCQKLAVAIVGFPFENSRYESVCLDKITQWNDDPARTIADIQRLVKEANV